MKTYRRLLKLVTPYWKRLVIAMICMVGVSAITPILAYLVKPVLDDIFINKNVKMLKLLPLVIIALYLMKGLFNYGYVYLMNWVGNRVIMDLRNSLYAHLQKLSISFFEHTPTGELISRLTNDVYLIQGAVSTAISGILRDLFSIIGLLIVVFYRDWKLALIAIIVFPLAVVPVVRFGQKLRKFSRNTQETMGNLSSLLQETISGNRIVKAFCMEDYEMERFKDENRRLFKLNMKNASIRAITSPLMEALGGLGVAFIVGYGGHQVIKGSSTPGNFFSFLTALFMLYDPVKKLSKMNNVIQQGLAAADRSFQILDTTPEITDTPHAKRLDEVRGEISFENVYFRYDQNWVLRDINLRATPGEVIALVGVSGAGKSTLVSLIPRFYDPQKGYIRLDGIDLKEIKLKDLRRHVAIVTQETILFNDTVKNNIAYGQVDIDMEEIVKAAKAAYAYNFINRLPKGFDTIIGEQGIMLSGGERQRLSIARALLKNAPILILDEATSSLDSEAEREIQKAIKNLIKGRTTFVIAHRLSTIQNADRIVVLSKGKIVETGRHEELLARKGEYWKLHQLQFKKVQPFPIDRLKDKSSIPAKAPKD